MSESPKLILASSSPRRRELLERCGLRFEVVASDIEEARIPGEEPADFAARLARDKALAIARRKPTALVLGADTIVVIGGRVLEKPSDAAEARLMLSMLSGATHTVITAFAIVRGSSALHSEAVESRVTFRELGAAEIDAYVATGEPLDKAGAYGIQAGGGGFITRVEGSRDNVMGLPVDRVHDALRRLGVERGCSRC